MSVVPETIRVSSLQRDAALEKLLLDDLLDLLHEADEPDGHRWLLAVLDALLRIHRREEGEYLEEVLDEYPSWDRQVQALHLEHRALFDRLRELRDEVFESSPGSPPCCLLDLHEWLFQINDHNGRATALLQTAINLEVGVGD